MSFTPVDVFSDPIGDNFVNRVHLNLIPGLESAI